MSDPAISIAPEFRTQVATVFQKVLKMSADDAEALAAQEKLSWEDLWNARTKMRAFPSLASLAKAGTSFWNAKLMKDVGLTEEFYRSFFNETIAVAAASDAKGTKSDALDDADEMSTLKAKLNAFIDTHRPSILQKALEGIFAGNKAMIASADRTGENYRISHAIDLDLLQKIPKDLFQRICALDPADAIRLKSVDFSTAQALLGRAMTKEEFEAIQALEERDLEVFATMDQKVVDQIDPQAEKTKSDILLSLAFSSGMFPEAVAYNVSFQHADNGVRIWHPVYENMYFYRFHPEDSSLIVYLRIPSKIPFLDHRHTLLRYQYDEDLLNGGRKQIRLTMSKAATSTSAPLTLPATEGYVEMVTLSGLMTVTARADGGSVLRMDVIGNPGMKTIPDWAIKPKLEAQYSKAICRGSYYLAYAIFYEDCLLKEFTTPDTICRRGFSTYDDFDLPMRVPDFVMQPCDEE